MQHSRRGWLGRLPRVSNRKLTRCRPGLEAVADDANLVTFGEPLNYTRAIKGSGGKAVYLAMVDNPPLRVWLQMQCLSC